LITVNTSGPAVSSHLDILVEEMAKAEGRKRKYEEQQKEREEKQNDLDLLEKLTRFTSGQLAHANHYVLDQMVLDGAEKKENEEKQKQHESEQRKTIAKNKEDDGFQKAYQKYMLGQPLAMVDMKHLLRKVKHRDDSPIRSKVGEIPQQWDKRKHCFDVFMPTPNVNNNVPVARTIVRDPVLRLAEEIIFDGAGSADRVLSDFAENPEINDERVTQEL
jgi:hypothetical protein